MFWNKACFYFSWEKCIIFISSSIHWSSGKHQLFPVGFRTSSWTRSPSVAKTEFDSNHSFESFVRGGWTSVIFTKLKAIGEIAQLQREQYGRASCRLERKERVIPARALLSPAASSFPFHLPAPSFQTGFFRFRRELRHTANIPSKQEINTRLPSGLSRCLTPPAVLPPSELIRDSNALLVAAGRVRRQQDAVCSSREQTRGTLMTTFTFEKHLRTYARGSRCKYHREQCRNSRGTSVVPERFRAAVKFIERKLSGCVCWRNGGHSPFLLCHSGICSCSQFPVPGHPYGP